MLSDDDLDWDIPSRSTKRKYRELQENSDLEDELLDLPSSRDVADFQAIDSSPKIKKQTSTPPPSEPLETTEALGPTTPKTPISSSCDEALGTIYDLPTQVFSSLQTSAVPAVAPPVPTLIQKLLIDDIISARVNGQGEIEVYIKWKGIPPLPEPLFSWELQSQLHNANLFPLPTQNISKQPSRDPRLNMQQSTTPSKPVATESNTPSSIILPLITTMPMEVASIPVPQHLNKNTSLCQLGKLVADVQVHWCNIRKPQFDIPTVLDIHKQCSLDDLMAHFPKEYSLFELHPQKDEHRLSYTELNEKLLRKMRALVTTFGPHVLFIIPRCAFVFDLLLAGAVVPRDLLYGLVAPKDNWAK